MLNVESGKWKVESGSSARLRLAGLEGKTADAVVKNAPAVRGTWEEKNGMRRGEECPLGMVKNLPAADGEEQLTLW